MHDVTLCFAVHCSVQSVLKWSSVPSARPPVPWLSSGGPTSPANNSVNIKNWRLLFRDQCAPACIVSDTYLPYKATFSLTADCQFYKWFLFPSNTFKKPTSWTDFFLFFNVGTQLQCLWRKFAVLVFLCTGEDVCCCRRQEIRLTNLSSSNSAGLTVLLSWLCHRQKTTFINWFHTSDAGNSQFSMVEKV